MESLRKRKRARKLKGKVDSCDAKSKKSITIDDIPESILLLEIFSRLHNPRDVIVCKSVSKTWNSLISSSLDYNPSLALILNTRPPQCVTGHICLEAWKGFELSKYVEPEFDSPVCVLASYRDVLLCMKYKFSLRRVRSQYYVVNPVTMRWTRVPKNSREFSTLACPIGLSGNGSKGRYYVVIMRPLVSQHKLEFRVLDSKRGKWRNYLVHWSLFRWFPMQRQALTLKGALHWLGHNGPIIAYNPKHKYRNECIVIHRSQEMHHTSYGDKAVIFETLTVSMGHLRIIQLVCYRPPDDHHHLVIWTLMDYKQSIWKQEHDPVYFRDMVSDVPWIQDYVRGYNLATTYNHSMSSIMKSFQYHELVPETGRHQITNPQPLHCHPNNPLLLYLYLPLSIVSLDVATKKLRLVTRISQRGMEGRLWNIYEKATPVTLHLRPSLVPDHERVLLPHK